MLESLYMRIYTCYDDIEPRAEPAEVSHLIFLPFRFHIAPPQFREPYKTSLWEQKGKPEQTVERFLTALSKISKPGVTDIGGWEQ